MRVSKLASDFVHPSPYQVWFKYINGTDLQEKIGPWEFTKQLQKNELIEVFYYQTEKKENLKCKILKHSNIPAFVQELLKIMVLSATLMACSACAMLDELDRPMSPQETYNFQMGLQGLAQGMRGFDTTGTSNALPMRQPQQVIIQQPCTNMYQCPLQYYGQ